MVNINEVLQRGFVLEETKFLSYDNITSECKTIANQYSPYASLSSIGKSEEGRDILLLKIGHGSKKVICVANEDSNETTGVNALVWLSKKLCSDDELREIYKNIQFLIVPTIDPDGYVNNWGWMSKFNEEPFDLKTYYIENFYRSIGELISVGFPFDNRKKVRPEVKALMNVIHSNRPDFYFNLHMTPIDPIDGVLFLTMILDENKKELIYSTLKSIVTQQDLLIAQTKIFGTEKTEDGIFPFSEERKRDMFDFLSEYLHIPKLGFSYGYACKHWGVRWGEIPLLLPEIPFATREGGGLFVDRVLGIEPEKETEKMELREYVIHYSIETVKWAFNEAERLKSLLVSQGSSLYYLNNLEALLRWMEAANTFTLSTLYMWRHNKKVDLRNVYLHYMAPVRAYWLAKLVKICDVALEETLSQAQLLLKAVREDYYRDLCTEIDRINEKMRLKPVSLKQAINVNIGLILAGTYWLERDK